MVQMVPAAQPSVVECRYHLLQHTTRRDAAIAHGFLPDCFSRSWTSSADGQLVVEAMTVQGSLP